MLETPVAFVVFNRPSHTRRVFERIRRARPRQLLVVADGPRRAHPTDRENCALVRSLIERGVDWPCDVQHCYSDTNLGAARRVSSGLDWVFSLTEEAIILEDDCLPDPTFFPFCSELLERYREEPKVAQIAGCSFQAEAIGGKASYYFSRYPHSWGWATWRRAWSHYDHSMKVWRENRGGEWLTRWVENPAERLMWEQSFDKTMDGRVDTWDYRWTLAVWHQGWVSVLPYRNLISNIGFGSEATHTHGSSPWAMLPLSPMRFPLTHPESLTPDKAADAFTSEMVFTPPSWPARFRRRLRMLFTR